MKWEIIMAHDEGHILSIIRESATRPSDESAHDLVANVFEIDHAADPEEQINDLGWTLTAIEEADSDH